MLRLLVLLVAVLGLASLLPSTPNAAALPAGTSDQDCLGQLHSALVRSGSRLVARDPETGEDVVLDSSSNPGDFRGVAGISELLALFSLLQRTGCVLPIPVLGACIDFDAGDACSPADADGDGYANTFEIGLGSDPHNAASTPEYALLDEQSGSNTCGDRIDNDLDGLIDNGDAGCRLTCKDFGPNQRCKDSDRDGWLAYLEEMYGSDPSNALSTPESPDVANTCGDGIDNDLDGYTDGADPGCGGDCIDFDDPVDCAPP